ncbi:MAG: hypothetical protein HOK28_17710 [Deltaproteobacteria bacterium]|nr:hypothetical protein [Deltaproteobacteria bacterium]
MSTRKRKSTRTTKRFWESYSNEDLMEVPISELGLTIKDSWLERPVEQLYDELKKRKLKLRPHVWLSEEWFCPDGISGFAIPFYLAHPRLAKLERQQMLEVEGGNLPWCMKLMRHETGHAIQNAFRLHRKRNWQKTFGRATVHYPETYTPKPGSKRFVLNLYYWYAQSHPVEDFAETFAVWLKPGTKWKNRYKGWPALQKLNYVNELMEELEGTSPPVKSRKQIDNLRSLKYTLREYYEQKQARYGKGFPDIYDRDLKRLFSDSPDHKSKQAASAFLRRNRRKLRKQVARWTGEYEFTLDQVFTHMHGRCRELGLRVHEDEDKILVDFAILLTMRTTQSLHAHRERVVL